MNRLTTTLLATTVLTTVGSGAFAATFIEGSTLPVIADFSNTAAGANSINFALYNQVIGALATPSDTADYFAFTGLTVSDNFTLNLTASSVNSVALNFSIDGVSAASLLSGGSTIRNGVLGSSTLTIGVTGIPPGTIGEGYSVTLSETPSRVPERSTMGIFAIGLAGLAAARRKRRR